MTKPTYGPSTLSLALSLGALLLGAQPVWAQTKQESASHSKRATSNQRGTTGAHSNSSGSAARISEVEGRLSSLGYWTGRVDGAADPGSRSALIAFQKAEGLPRT